MGGEAAAGAGWSRRVTGGGGLRQLVGGAVLKPHAERRTLRALARRARHSKAHGRVRAVVEQREDDARRDQERGYSQPPPGAVNTQPLAPCTRRSRRRAVTGVRQPPSGSKFRALEVRLVRPRRQRSRMHADVITDATRIPLRAAWRRCTRHDQAGSSRCRRTTVQRAPCRAYGETALKLRALSPRAAIFLTSQFCFALLCFASAKFRCPGLG